MKHAYPYDPAFEPPAPIVPVGIMLPNGGDAIMLRMLVDTGADGTLVPASLARRLGLPRVDEVKVSGVGGAAGLAHVHAALLSIGPVRRLARVIGFGDEAVVGRDVLRWLAISLDGEAERLTLGVGVARSQRRRQRSSGRR